MLHENERRSYQRSSIKGDVSISSDGKTWHPAAINDLSSTGVQLICENEFINSAKLNVKLTLYGMTSDFNVCTDAVIRHSMHTKHNYVYGLEFVGLSKDTRIRIDEVIMHMRPRSLMF